MGTIWFLVVFPLLAAGACLLVREDRLRTPVVAVSAAVTAVGSIVLAARHLTGAGTYYVFDSRVLGVVFMLVELALCGYVIWRALHARRYGVFALACVQALLILLVEFTVGARAPVRHALYADTLSSVMALVIGIIGSGICVYALGYMRDFQDHQDKLLMEGDRAAADRRPAFFAVMFAFLSAMFGIVLFNDLAWMLCAWEVTTVCSFYLIGYTRTPEATANAFRQIWMNLVGGIAFSLAVLYIGTGTGVMELDRFVAAGVTSPSAVMLPLALLAVAALTKSAQMPFHTWLLGAMVAPTPTSALLHSSTMVKAGVFLLIRLSPLMGTFVAGVPRMGMNPVGISVMLVGATTFLLASLIAVSQSNAKRVLAYSTIANLGLIVACTGIGTAAAAWAAIFLLVFHAAAKSLLFLCVGTAEHHIGSRDIEDMDSLITRMPRLTVLMALGICGMFVAPFGMLVSKWAALGAFVNSGVILIVAMLVFGSAATFFFWAKWLAKVMAGRPGAERVEDGVHLSEWVSLGLMAALLVVCSVLLTLLSADVVSPYVRRLVGGAMANPTGADLAVMAVCALVMVAVPAAFALRAKDISRGDGHLPYFSGVGTSAAGFKGSLGTELAYTQRNWYLEGVFDERRLGMVGTVVCALLACMCVSASIGMTVVFLGSVI